VGGLRLKTIGIHPLTDALQLHALVDTLHTYGLDRYVDVVPREGHHELLVPDALKERVVYALMARATKSILQEILLIRGTAEEGGVNERLCDGLLRAASKDLEALREVALGVRGADDVALPGKGLVKAAKLLAEAVVRHFTEAHPALPDVKSFKKGLEGEDTKPLLEFLLEGNRVKEVKRAIPLIPSIGKFYYIDAKVGSWGAHKLDATCGRLLRAGLRLAMTYPVRLGEGSYAVGIALVTPRRAVRAREVWRAQAMLRTLRRRWVRGSWGRAHAAIMLLDAFRLLKSFSEDAAGYVVEVILTHTQGWWRGPRSAEEVKVLSIPNAERRGQYWRYCRGVAVASESVTPTHRALRLAKKLESLGGSTDWLVDEFLRRYYVVRGEGGWTLNYGFLSSIVKALTEYDVEALYTALREAAVVAGGEGRPLVRDAYQLERLVAALESLAGGGLT